MMNDINGEIWEVQRILIHKNASDSCSEFCSVFCPVTFEL